MAQAIVAASRLEPLKEVSWMPVHTKEERSKKGLKRGAKGRIVKVKGSKAKKTVRKK